MSNLKDELPLERINGKNSSLKGFTQDERKRRIYLQQKLSKERRKESLREYYKIKMREFRQYRKELNLLLNIS